MKRRLHLVLLSVATVLFAGTQGALGCLWDTDTLIAERARFPEVTDIMTGNFPRHSRGFYEWRVKTCKAALEKDKTQTALYDDLAVAQHKLGDHKAAIATMKRKEQATPGLYETYSNLGTFYIYTGELKEAVKWIDMALKINPNAHFGREKYQKWLVEWVLAGKPGKPEYVSPPGVLFGYARFVLEKQHPDLKKLYDISGPLEEARKGVLGMMRFADFDNPLLQEALGDILASGELANAGHLAAQAYLMALKNVKSKSEMPRIQQKYAAARKDHKDFDEKGTQADLEMALTKGKALANDVARDEAGWIKAAEDATAKYAAKYLPPDKLAAK
jgi:tetratricopeptide (TPR) repeat protein